jgi:hypothetical protein
VWLRVFGHDDTRANNSPEERAQDRERQLAAIAESADIAVKGLNASEIRIKLAARLDGAGKYLWVVDDLPSDLSWEATEPWFAPSVNGHTLISTRRRHEGGQRLQVRVEELDEEDAYVLLTTQRSPESDDEQSVARRIVRALDQFGVLRDAKTHPELTNDALHARRLIEACRTSPDENQAPAQAALLGVLARFEAGLGRYVDSRGLYYEALELSRRVNGETHSLTLAIAASFGTVLTSSGDFAAARVLLEQTLQTAKETYGDDSVVTLGVKESLAAMLLSAGTHQAAIPMMREVVEAQLRTPGADLQGLLLTLNNLANAQLSAGEAKEAEELIRMVVTARTAVLGPDHPHTLMSRNTLAGTLHNQGKTVEAIDILQPLVADMTRVLGATHPDTLNVRSNLASLIGQRMMWMRLCVRTVNCSSFTGRHSDRRFRRRYAPASTSRNR